MTRGRSHRACARTVITRCSSTTFGRRSRFACTSCPSCPTGPTTTWSVPCAAGAFRSARPRSVTYVRCPTRRRCSAQAVLPQAQYMAQAERFWRQLGVNPAGQQPLTPASPGAPVPAQPAAPVRPAAPAPPPPTAADDQTSWVAQLHQLAQLHDQGVLSDADYAAAKQRILEQDKQPQPPGPASPPPG